MTPVEVKCYLLGYYMEPFLSAGVGSESGRE